MSEASERWQRVPVPGVLWQGERMLLVAADGAVRQLEGASAELAGAVLELLVAPRTRDELAAEVARLAGEPLPRREIVDEVLMLLRASGAVRAAGPPPAAATARLDGARVVLGLTGAIGAMH